MLHNHHVFMCIFLVNNIDSHKDGIGSVMLQHLVISLTGMILGVASGC